MEFNLTTHGEFEDLDEEYAQFIMEHGSNDDVVICDGDTLLKAMDENYLLDEFVQHKIKQLEKKREENFPLGED